MESLLSFYAGIAMMAGLFGAAKFVRWMIGVETARADLELAVKELERRVDRLEGRKP